LRNLRYDPCIVTVEALDARIVALVRGAAPVRRGLAQIAGPASRARAESL
jgi:hypothetical protein